MKIVKSLIPLLLFILAITCLSGCSHVDKTNVEAVITNELDLLKNLNSDATQKYVSYKELFPDATSETNLSKDVKDVFSLFFQNFDYKILNINVDNDKKEASAQLRLSTVDAYALAKDYAQASLEAAILNAADSDTTSTEESTDSMEERYLILDQLLKSNSYATVERECTMQLRNSGSDDRAEWEIVRSHALENDLVGGLMTDLSNNDLLSPEETLTVYLNTLKTMDTVQMGNYLGIESLLNTSDTDKNSIASALVAQVHKNFDFTITSCDEQSYSASVQTKITTFDSAAILDAYQTELDTYLASADAVIDGSEKRYENSMSMLLNNIESNTSTVSSDATFHLTNDGVSWKLQDSNISIGNAIFGTLSSSPVSDTSAISSEEANDKGIEDEDENIENDDSTSDDENDFYEE
ncbi:hypothetical protein [Blautia sp. MSJ-19]|uniref:hypothetical protein n=1 Tax=Blautia sp. MSJ-19 TaxID=2841517 RepID=UPI00209D3BED|nr:hypothetical protein [Blautia sp. MSJ-19]